MSAQYQFLPWVRAGAVRAYANTDTPQPVLARDDRRPLTALPVTLTVNDRPPLGVALRLYGPGDVAGIDRRAVIRTDPPPHSADLEPNYLACVEFDTPDFPWMFTPAAARSQGRLRPWLCLVVVRRGEAVTLGFTPDKPLPVLSAPVEELPDLGESWAWAHGQVVQADASEPVDHILASVPQRNLSRLLCPRRLEPHTAYLACVVPTFDAGRRAGLGLEVTAEDDTALGPAWDGAQARVELPVYHHWEFATGAGGDFETLADLLEGRVAGDAGRRPLRAAGQPFGLGDPGPLELQGPLVAPGAPAAPVPNDEFRRRLRALLNLSEEPVVTPPVYGSWHAGQPTVPGDEQAPRWLRELNLDPAARAAAGLGARVVQDRQEQLVASAWEQLGDPKGVAGLERRLDFGVAVLSSVLRRHMATMDAGRLLQFLGPAQARMRTSRTTLQATLALEGLPPSFTSAPLRRALRPAGSVARRRSASPLSLQAVATRMRAWVAPVEPATGTAGLVDPEPVRRQLATRPVLTPPMRRHRQALAQALDYVDAFGVGALPAPRPPFHLDAELKAGLLAALEPRQYLQKRLYARVTSAGAAVAPPERPGATILSQPSFPQPMYEALRDISPELLLPGVGLLDANTVTVLKTNPRFIEAYMAGLNHEIVGELLWREFPGDLRHTYFRAFWDAGEAGTAQLADMHTWNPDAPLGGSFGAGVGQLVLLIRGELLRRHPDALIYAVPAKDATTLGDAELLPAFRGRIEPDITFVGFALGEDEARSLPPSQPGWFFVIQEQPSAPRFGLDEARTRPLSTWNDLAWSDTRTAPGTSLRLDDLSVLAGERPAGPTWGFNAAHLAAILRQRPVRVAFHADRLLPPRPS